VLNESNFTTTTDFFDLRQYDLSRHQFPGTTQCAGDISLSGSLLLPLFSGLHKLPITGSSCLADEPLPALIGQT
jgi:hypothetical protein